MLSAIQISAPTEHEIISDFGYTHKKGEDPVQTGYHYHDYYEVYIFISGKVNYLIEGRSYVLMPGDILLINSKELHKPVIEPGEAYERIIFYIDNDYILRQSTYKNDLAMCFTACSKNKNNLLRPSSKMAACIMQTASRLEEESCAAEYGNRILLGTYIIELLVYLNRVYLEAANKEAGSGVYRSDKINSVVRFINENLEADLSLDYISSMFFLSKFHLIREFKRYTGYTIHRYIHKKRLIMSKALLKEGFKVSDVYMKCGFSDYSNFFRSFKKEFGISPREFLLGFSSQQK